MEPLCEKRVGYDRFVGECAYRQLIELYRVLRLYVNCFQPSMKLQAKQRDGKKVRYVYDPAKTPLQRLLLSGVLPTQKQQELSEVAQALDPFLLFQQLEQLQQAVFCCADSGTPFVPTTRSAPVRVFSVERCTTGNVPAERSIPDPAAGLHTLYREQERRKRVLGWWRTHKDPFEGEWEQITRLSGCQPRTVASATFSGNCKAAPPDAINHYKYAPCIAECGKSELTYWKPWRSTGKRK